MRVLIAGGGVGGLACALALARHGHDVAVYEQAEAPAELGAGVQLSPNATRILNELGLAGALARIASEPDSLDLRCGLTGRAVFSLPVGADARRRYGAPYLHVHRADLLDALVAAVRAEPSVELNYGQSATSFEASDRQARLVFAGGGAVSGDGLVIADGLRSTLRRRLLGDQPPRYSGACAYRFLAPAEAMDRHCPEQAAIVWTGPSAHAVTYRVRQGALINFVGVVEAAQPVEESWTRRADPVACQETFARWAAPVRAMVAAAGDVRCWGLYERKVPDRWSRGAACLLGDACHPMPPFQAQGAAMAIEDAWALARRLADGKAPFASAAAAYGGDRRDRCRRMLASAHRNRRLFHLHGPVRRIAHAGLSLADRFARPLLRLPQDWIYAHEQ
jgi:salicylate hydroxylase